VSNEKNTPSLIHVTLIFTMYNSTFIGHGNLKNHKVKQLVALDRYCIGRSSCRVLWYMVQFWQGF